MIHKIWFGISSQIKIRWISPKNGTLRTCQCYFWDPLKGSLTICSIPVVGSNFLPIGHLRRGVTCECKLCFPLVWCCFDSRGELHHTVTARAVSDQGGGHRMPGRASISSRQKSIHKGAKYKRLWPSQINLHKWRRRTAQIIYTYKQMYKVNGPQNLIIIMVSEVSRCLAHT